MLLVFCLQYELREGKRRKMEQERREREEKERIEREERERQEQLERIRKQEEEELRRREEEEARKRREEREREEAVVAAEAAGVSELCGVPTLPSLTQHSHVRFKHLSPKSSRDLSDGKVASFVLENSSKWYRTIFSYS